MVSDMQNDIAKAILKNSDNIIDAIDRYLAKADDDLQNTLKEEGYVEPKETVTVVNSLEEEIANVLHEQTDSLLETLQEAEKDGADLEELQRRILALLSADDIAVKIETASEQLYEIQVPKLASVYMEEYDGELVVETIRERTSSWIRSWSQTLGELTKISTHEQISSLIENTISEGLSIADLTRKIQEGGWRSEYYQARRFALTETLRTHSVAHEEAIQQSPACEEKEWRHTGGSKNKPRPNHVAMDGQIVPKNKPFELEGKDGIMYYPMYPRDSILPASESVNCHCIHRGIVNKDVLGLSLEERKALQQKYMESDNSAWQKELNDKAKSSAGMTPDSVMDSFNEKTRENQTKYLGGKAKMALYDAGLIDSEDMLKKVKNSTLQELRDDGIFTVDSTAVKHSTVGEFSNLSNPKKPAGGRNGGNMKGGGHSQANLDELSQRGIVYSVEKTYDNGVRIGGVANHTSSDKRLGSSGQSWFPESWDSEKISAAGTYTANKPAITEELYDDNGKFIGYRKFQKFDNLTVGIFEDTEHNIDTIFPDAEQREVGD